MHYPDVKDPEQIEEKPPPQCALPCVLVWKFKMLKFNFDLYCSFPKCP